MLNQMTVIGNVGKTPVLEKTVNGQDIVRFSVAVTETRLRDGEKSKFTEWFSITLWGRNAETAAKYLKAGNPVWVQGRLSVSSYADGIGELRHSLNIAGSQIGLLPSRQASEPVAEPQSVSGVDDVDLNDYPF